MNRSADVARYRMGLPIIRGPDSPIIGDRLSRYRARRAIYRMTGCVPPLEVWKS